MEQTQREALKDILVELIDGIVQRAHSREEIVIENIPDTIDLVQRAGERELAIRQIESDFSKLRNIKMALARLEDGSYGTCLECDREIGINRLKAVPWAAYCVTCQEMADRESRDVEQEWLLPA